jgi:hypothetical protein
MDGFTMDETQIVFTGPEYRERENQQRLTVLDFY